MIFVVVMIVKLSVVCLLVKCFSSVLVSRLLFSYVVRIGMVGK